MKETTNCSLRAIGRILATASAGTLILVSQTSCGSGGLFSKDDSAADASLIEEPKKGFRRGSLFDRAKERNSYIDDRIQTTRRDRFAAQAASSAPEVAPASPMMMDPDPAAMMDPLPRTPDTQKPPKANLPLETTPPPSTASNTRTGEPSGLPTLDSDFPQPTLPGDIGEPAPPTPAPAPAPAPSPAPGLERDEEGYTPLQPKLPGLETIIPPSE